MQSKLLKPAAVVIALLSLAACGGNSSDSSVSDDDAPANTVVMKLIAFKPGRLAVPAGTEVTWRQTDPGQHTVTSGAVEQGSGGVKEMPDGLFDSGPIDTDKTFRFTFVDAGTYAYFCAIHPATMRGEISVS